MEHVITAKDVLITLGVLGGIVGALALFFGLVWLFNPFRSGH